MPLTPGGDPSESVIRHADGTFTLLDEAGLPTSTYTSDGVQLTDGGLSAAMSRQFEALFNRGFTAMGDALTRSLNPAPAPAPAAAAAASAQKQLVQYALIGGLAFLAYKAFSG